MRIAVSVSEKEKAKGAESAYYRALLAVGVKPHEIELVSASDAPPVHAEDYAGILFAGGDDVDPSFYGEDRRYESVHTDHARDEFEFGLVDRALTRHLPILAICRGVQMINVKFGGTLYQNLNGDATPQVEHCQTDLSKPRQEATHAVLVTDPESSLGAMIPRTCRVNSLHHQAVKCVGRGLKVTARSEDGFVEAVESAADYPFLVAVQWHPEEMVHHSAPQRGIFVQFVAECRQRSGATSPPRERQKRSRRSRPPGLPPRDPAV
jgi:putative glutamine amidotransferase